MSEVAPVADHFRWAPVAEDWREAGEHGHAQADLAAVSRTIPKRRFALVVAVLAATGALAQVPFGLDTSFQAGALVPPPLYSTGYSYCSSALALDDGRVLVSGRMHFEEYRDPQPPGWYDPVSLARLLPDGSVDTTFHEGSPGGGKLTPWNGQFYVGTGLVRRIWPDGTLDNAFISPGTGPYFSFLQGGDYHVYPDGRVLMSGAHHLDDTIRGFDGLYNLIWFSDQGYLDTTRIHRRGNGVVYEFEQLQDGGFICTGTCSEWEGQPTNGWIFKTDSTGALDTTFQSGVFWGTANAFLPLPDGRCYAGGLFRIAGIPDTLQLARFLPDGSLDPTFNHLLDIRATDLTAPFGASVRGLHALNDGNLIVTGEFETVEGEPRQAICLIDSTGQLSNDHFTGPGCDEFTYQGYTYGSLSGITSAPDGSWYIYGAYHGYDDGTTNDPQQRMVSRLFGLDVGVQEVAVASRWQLAVWPNPVAQGGVATVQLDLPDGVDVGPVELVVQDVMGREVRRERMVSTGGVSAFSFSVSAFSPGTYLLHLVSEGRRLAGGKLLVE